MPASWNARNRKVAKLSAKNNWYMGKTEVEQPAASSHEEEKYGRSSQQEEESRNAGKPQPEQTPCPGVTLVVGSRQEV
jgi:hypothetical protein